MLKEFKKNDVKVTFFVTGKWAEKNKDMMKEIIKEGHMIENHAYKHCHFNQLNETEIIEQIKKAEDIIYETSKVKSKYLATPYGEYNNLVLKVVTDLNYKLIMWSVDTIDWQKPQPQIILNRVKNKIHNDAFILMHPTEPTLKALPDILDYLKTEKYDVVLLDNLISLEKEKEK